MEIRVLEAVRDETGQLILLCEAEGARWRHLIGKRALESRKELYGLSEDEAFAVILAENWERWQEKGVHPRDFTQPTGLGVAGERVPEREGRFELPERSRRGRNNSR